MAREITIIKVYWDAQDPGNECWVYASFGSDALIASGALDSDSLEDAIEEACWNLDIDITPDQFAREPHIDGGIAIWTAE